MNDTKWSDSEKKAARRAYEAAFARECGSLIVKLKEHVARASEPTDLWEIHDFLSAARKEIDDKYDYRYSMLIWVFTRLMREGWLTEDDLKGLKQDKVDEIKMLASR